jgi:methionyl-tRNA formyltransferase
MKILLLTQDDPFYLYDAIDSMINKLPDNINIVGCVLFPVSPFGKKESFFEKIFRTIRIFGVRFFLNYAKKYVVNKFLSKRSLKKLLTQNSIPLIELDESINTEVSLMTLSSYGADLFVSFAGNEIFKRNLINLPPKGCINAHSSRLPKNRGLMPTFWSMLNGEKTSAVSVFFVDEGIDTGPIIVQKGYNLESLTLDQAIQHSKALAVDCIVESIIAIASDKVELTSNDDCDATYNSFPTREDVRKFKRIGGKFF